MQKTLFVVTRPAERDPEYLFKDPESGMLVPGDELDNAFCHQPEPFEEDQALALAEALNLAGAYPRWEVCVAPSPCPGCGRQMWANDFDFCYPRNRERTQWRAGCNVHDFGCGFEVETEFPAPEDYSPRVESANYLATIAQWNAAKVFEYPNESYARVEYLGIDGLEAALKDVFQAYPEYQNKEQYPEGFDGMVAKFASDPFYNLHFVARQYLYLRGPKEA